MGRRAFTSKKVTLTADFILQKCKLVLMRRVLRKREIPEYKIIEDALRLYYAYLKGYLDRELVTKALARLEEEERL